jgi:CRP-like cAMP-binding protein
MSYLSESTVVSSLSSARSVDFPSRVTIIDEGEPARAIYQIVSGNVMISKLLPDGRRQIFELLGPGGLFGVTPNGHHDSVAESLTDVRLTAFDKIPAENSSRFNSFMAEGLKIQICALHEHAVLLGRKSAVERVASYIAELIPTPSKEAKINTDIVTVRVLMTRSEIADYLGLTLETVSRVFSNLKRSGIIGYERHDGQMKVHIKRLRPLTGTY